MRDRLTVTVLLLALSGACDSGSDESVRDAGNESERDASTGTDASAADDASAKDDAGCPPHEYAIDSRDDGDGGTLTDLEAYERLRPATGLTDAVRCRGGR